MIVFLSIVMSDYTLIAFHITPAVWNKSLAFAHKCSVYNIIAPECQSLSLFWIVCLDIISVNSWNAMHTWRHTYRVKHLHFCITYLNSPTLQKAKRPEWCYKWASYPDAFINMYKGRKRAARGKTHTSLWGGTVGAQVSGSWRGVFLLLPAEVKFTAHSASLVTALKSACM